MRITYSRPAPDALTLDLEPDGQDAAPPLRRLRFRARGLARLREPRAALLGYLAVRDLVGNRLEFGGLRMPSFLAAAILAQGAHSELYLEGVTNAAEALAPREAPRRLAFAAPAPGDLLAEPSEQGWRLREAAAGGAPGPVLREIRTNLRAFLALAARRPAEVERAVLALLAHDLLGAARLRLPEGLAPPPALALLGEVGFRLEAEEAA